MSSHTQHPPPQGDATVAPHQDDTHGPWVYNKMINVVIHEPDHCNLCSQWAVHLSGYRLRCVPSIMQAEKHCNTAIHGSLELDVKSLQSTNKMLSCELNAIQDDLEHAENKLQGADKEINHLKNKLDDVERQLDDTIRDHEQKIDFLCDKIAELKCRQTPHCRKLPRHGSHTPSPSRSQHASSQSSHPVSPMIEDQGPPSYCSSVAPLLLLSRLALSAASSTTSLSNRENPPSLAKPSPSGGSEFFPNVATVAAPTDPSVPTSIPITPIVRFPSLLPVLYYDANGQMLVVPGTAHTDHTGNVDFSDERFVLADGGLTADGLPNWSTTLLQHERLLTKQVVEGLKPARNTFASLPSASFLGGGTAY